MQSTDGRLLYSASDLNNFIACPHLLELERLVALGELAAPEPDDAAKLLARKGGEHEERHLERLQAAFGSDLVQRPVDEAATLAAMASGARIIFQAAFYDGTFRGYADFLRRVDRPSANWAWSYEALDTKLALSTKPYFLIQLCNYSEHLARLQGSMPHEMAIVLGNGEERRYRVDDFIAYYRHTKAAFLARVAEAPTDTYPFVTEHCTICRWNARCAAQRDRDDHLSIVAGIRKEQILKLEGGSVATLGALGRAEDVARPNGLAVHAFDKLRSQARLQHISRTERRNVYEFLETESNPGFGLLPQPDEGDLFFDMEGDPLYSAERGLEYLFGVYAAHENAYHAFWARDDRHEKHAFEQLMDFLVERRAKYPSMHVYHYAAYETIALRRLMGHYATREREVDDLLRNGYFVDLFTVARQTMRISQPSYSLKKFEAFYGMTRATDVKRGDDSIVMFESWRANGDDAILEDIERYNEDDCRSTHLLHRWLLERRSESEGLLGITFPWHTTEPNEPPDEAERSELAQRLLGDLQAPRSLHEFREAAEPVRARWLLGHVLEYHHREAKPVWWQLFDRVENVDRLLEFDHETISGLMLQSDATPYKLKPRDQNLVYTYTFPEQQHNLSLGETLYSPDHGKPMGKAAGAIVELNDETRTLKIKLTRDIVPMELRSLIPGGPRRTDTHEAALARIATAYVDGTLERDHPATLSLVLARAPKLRTPRDVIQPAVVDRDAVSGLVGDLDGSHLVVQGPPGSGKSTLGGAFISDLLAAGKTVAIVSNGHKAIHNLLRKVEEQARERNVAYVGLQKWTAGSPDSQYTSPFDDSRIETLTDGGAFAKREHQLAAGTSWLFTRDDLVGRYDYLIVDEAGQMSLADALACSATARNVVLLGDPLQLAQVSQGSHPIGTSPSVLEHLLGESETIPPSQGVFLNVSYRMHPSICSFISHAVYEDRLHAAPLCVNNRIESPTLSGSGLRFIPIAHEGNRRASREEAEIVVETVAALLKGTVQVASAAPRQMTANDILVVSPYNAQRKLLRKHLEAAGFPAVRVGTVDKFQGQEAPIVVYSMATSSGDDMPRDMAFLFEKNRLNVAISRAQCLSLLVCSPELLSVRCNTPEQMALVNLLCDFAERGTAG